MSGVACHYLSGPDLDGRRDGDRCWRKPTVRLKFRAQPDERWTVYCQEHAGIAVAAFETAMVELIKDAA